MKRMLGIVCNVSMLVLGLFISGFSQITGEYFDTVTVNDPRKETRCHNFADYGASYKFKILGGIVYYSRNGEFIGEFRQKDSTHATFIDHTTERNKPTILSAVTMITARNNRVMAYDSINNRLFWASMVTEFDKDYQGDITIGGVKQKKWYSDTACYSKLDPDEGVATSNPVFCNNDRHFYSLQAYKNTLRFDSLKQLTMLGVKLEGKVPDLADLSTKSYVATSYINASGTSIQTMGPGPIMSDVMQVMVAPKVWQLIDGTSPRNDVSQGQNVMKAQYNLRKQVIFHQMTGIMTKVLTDLLNTKGADGMTNERKIKELIKSNIDEAAASAKKKLTPTMSDAVYYSLLVCCGWLPSVHSETVIRAGRWAIDNEAKEVKPEVDRLDFNNFIKAITKFYNQNLDYAILHYEDMGTLATEINNANPGKTLDERRVLACNKNLDNTGDVLTSELQNAVSNLDDGITLFKDQFSNGLNGQIRDWAKAIITSLKEFDPTQALTINPDGTKYHTYNWEFYGDYAVGRTMYWADISRGINNWYKYYQFPSDSFKMEYVPLKSGNYTKTKVTVMEIYGIGVNTCSRYEHYRFHLGGEYGAFYGKIKGPKTWEYAPKPNDIAVTDPGVVDGHGYIDGTCNFYILAKIGLINSNNSTTYVPAVMWLDEQEYFAERWHVLDPKDNAFEGIGGAMMCAFPNLTWFNGINPNVFEKKYYTPYRKLTSRARMATSGTAIVVTGDSLIYSTSFYWAVTDATWRWRKYPTLAYGESIDTQSVKMRDDMTIYFKGKKLVGTNNLIDGYWYQQYLGPDLALKGYPALNAPPATGFTHPWNFMGKEAFDYADKKFYKMGMYDVTTFTPSDSSDHYCYKGYNPKVHVLIFPPIRDRNTAEGPVRDFLNKNFDPKSEYNLRQTLLVRSDYYGHILVPLKALYHPMYKDMDSTFKKPVMLKFVHLAGYVVGYFPDPRNDDLNLRGATFALESKNSTNKTLCYVDTGKYYDLNVWADAPVKTCILDYNSSSEQLSCKVTLADIADTTGKYMLYGVKIGCIENNQVKILYEIPFNEVLGSKTYSQTGSYGIDKAVWNKYFSNEGKAKYGTSAWVEDVFGNNNVANDLTILVNGISRIKPQNPLANFMQLLKSSKNN